VVGRSEIAFSYPHNPEVVGSNSTPATRQNVLSEIIWEAVLASR